MAYEQPVQETKFNAGVDIALDISRLFKEAEYFSFNGKYPLWHLKLESIERRMWTKFEKDAERKKEIKKIHSDNIKEYRIYLRKISLGKIIPKNLMETIKTYLVEYEKLLICCRDKFGYGMPLKEDARKAAWR